MYSGEEFTALITAAVNGTYLDPFLGDAIEDDEYEKRLRAVMQNRFSDFCDSIRDRGERRKIVTDDDVVNDEATQIIRFDFVDQVQNRM